MATKKKTKATPKAEHHAAVKKVPPKKEVKLEVEEQQPEAEAESKDTLGSFVPRLDQKDERSEEEKVTDLESKKKDKSENEEETHKRVPPPREVPHIDIPVIEDKGDASLPVWHQVNDDLPSIARPVSNVPAPVPPSQSLTSAPPAIPEAQEPAGSKQKNAENSVSPLPDAYIPIDEGTVQVQETRPEPAEKATKVQTKVEDMDKQNQKKSSWPFFIAGALVGVVVLFIFVWGYVRVGKLPIIKFQKTPSASLMPSITPLNLSPTPVQQSLVRSEIRFEVFNGSGVKGAAASAAKKLTDLGYTVILTGNADEGVAATQLFVATPAEKFEDAIFDDVVDLFPEATKAGILEDSDTTASARLVVGKK